MVLDRQGYDDLIMYLTQNLALFEKPGEIKPGAPTVMELIVNYAINFTYNLTTLLCVEVCVLLANKHHILCNG